MSGRRVDWYIQALTNDVLMHFWYSALRKMHDSVENHKECAIMAFDLILAQDIPNSDVTLPAEDDAPIFVTSTMHKHICYVVQNLREF